MPPHPGANYEEVIALERVAKEDPANIRSYLYERAITLAHNSGCEHGEKLETWTHENRERVTTCGRLQAEPSLVVQALQPHPPYVLFWHILSEYGIQFLQPQFSRGRTHVSSVGRRLT